jgi:hypothetical protein
MLAPAVCVSRVESDVLRVLGGSFMGACRFAVGI